jgi:hypothetical protein
MTKLVSPSPMQTQHSLIIKSNIPEIKRICEKKGIDYEVIRGNLIKKVRPSRKPKISQQELKLAYQKLAKSKNYEKEMKE